MQRTCKRMLCIHLFPQDSATVSRMTPTTAETAAEPDAARPLRADALRNRALILDTARRLFAERGLGVTLNDIAHEAGVGVGTVYRRFADKDAVIAALRADKFAVLRGLAQRAAEVDDPREALRGYLHEVMAVRVRDRAIHEAVAGAPHGTDDLREERDRLGEEVERVIERARAAGVVREGFAARDVPLLTMMIGGVADRAGEAHPQLWRRYAALVIDAVCPPPASSALPGDPLSAAALPAVMHRRG